MAKHKIFEKRTEVVDPETGEITGNITTEKKYVYNVDADKFYMTFIDFTAPLYKLKSDSAKNVLQWMCCNAEFNTGIVYLPAPRMEEMSEFLNMPKQSIYNNIVQLKKLGLLTGERGKFMINPEIFWKGDIQTRRQLLESNGGAVSVTFSITPNENFNNK